MPCCHILILNHNISCKVQTDFCSCRTSFVHYAVTLGTESVCLIHSSCSLSRTNVCVNKPLMLFSNDLPLVRLVCLFSVKWLVSQKGSVSSGVWNISTSLPQVVEGLFHEYFSWLEDALTHSFSLSRKSKWMETWSHHSVWYITILARSWQYRVLLMVVYSKPYYKCIDLLVLERYTIHVTSISIIILNPVNIWVCYCVVMNSI